MKKLLLIALLSAPAMAQNAPLVDETIADLERRLEEQDARSRKDREALEKMIRGMAFDISELRKQLEQVKKSIPAKPAPEVLPMAETDLLVPNDPMKDARAAFDAKDYKQAAIMYAELIKSKLGDFYQNLLYLGRSMAGLDKKKEACESFANIADAADAGDELRAVAKKDASEMDCYGQP
jgi:TolA-binding protein